MPVILQYSKRSKKQTSFRVIMARICLKESGTGMVLALILLKLIQHLRMRVYVQLISKNPVINFNATSQRVSETDVPSVTPSSGRIEGLTFETSVLKTLYRGQLTLSTQLLKPNHYLLVPDAESQFHFEAYSFYSTSQIWNTSPKDSYPRMEHTQTMMDLNLTVKTYATPAQMRCKLDLLQCYPETFRQLFLEGCCQPCMKVLLGGDDTVNIVY